MVTTTFGLGAGPMPDVATDPSTHRAYVTSKGDDSLYVADPTSRVTTIKWDRHLVSWLRTQPRKPLTSQPGILYR